MSNIVKSFYINHGEQKRVIDYNELVQEKIRIAAEERAQAEAAAEHNLEAGEAAEAGFVAGLAAEVIELPEEALAELQARTEQAQVTAESIVAQANAEAEQILRSAKREADSMWEKAYAQAKKDGYDAGVKEGRVEVDRMRNEFLKEKKQQQKEYVELLESMEKDLVDVILEVFGKVTGVIGPEKKDIMLHLIGNTLNHIESSKEFIIRVSKDDYPFVSEHKELLAENVLQNASFEIVKDVTMEKGQCLIETDGGIFDCSLDIQLENLIMDIKALSCM